MPTTASGTEQHGRLLVAVCGPDGLSVRAPGLARWLAGVAPRKARGSVAVVLVSDRRMRTLNRVWRSTDRPTDVLSFPMNDVHVAPRTESGLAATSARKGGGARASAPAAHLGDIVIATGVATRQARALGHSVQTELRVLALHGLLHLLGYDHERDRGQMARVESRLRRKGGLRGGLIERRRPTGSRAPRRSR